MATKTVMYVRTVTSTSATACGTDNYFVSPSGDNGHPGTLAEPWRTLSYAVEQLSPGDTLHVRSGTYYERVDMRHSGTAGNYITIRAYTGEHPLIDGTGVYNNVYPYGMLDIRNVSYVIIDGIHVRMSNNALILVDTCSYIEINNCYTDLSYASGIGVWWSDNIKVNGNDVKNSHYISIPAGGHEESISIAGTTNFEVNYNEVYRDGAHPAQFGDLGIDCKQGSRFGIVHHNYVHDYDSDSGTGGIYIDAWDRLTGDIDVYDNYINNSAVGIDISSEQGGTCENVRVYNNIIYNTNANGIHLQKRPPPYDYGIRRNIEIYNNTIYKLKYNGGAGIYITADHISNIIIRNNIVYTTFGKWNGLIVAGSTSLLPYIKCDHNIGYGPTECSADYPSCRELIENPAGYPDIFGNIYGDPLFTSLVTPDFHLLDGSPAINTGTTIALVTDDYDGVARPQGAAYDMGALEHI
jgi:hypothetical protein